MSAATASELPKARVGAPLLEIRDLHVTYATGEPVACRPSAAST